MSSPNKASQPVPTAAQRTPPLSEHLTIDELRRCFQSDFFFLEESLDLLGLMMPITGDRHVATVRCNDTGHTWRFRLNDYRLIEFVARFISHSYDCRYNLHFEATDGTNTRCADLRSDGYHGGSQ